MYKEASGEKQENTTFLVNVSIQLQQELQAQQNEISREMRLKEKLDKEVKQLHNDMEAKMADIKALNLQGQRAKEEQQRLEQQLKELKVRRVTEWTGKHRFFNGLVFRKPCSIQVFTLTRFTQP